MRVRHGKIRARDAAPDPRGASYLGIHHPDTNIKWVAFGIALVLHAGALALRLPEVRRANVPERKVEQVALIKRYVPPPPVIQRARIIRTKTTRKIPVPDPTPELPEPVAEPLPESLFSDPFADDDYGVLLGVPVGPPDPRGGGGGGEGTVSGPLIAGVGGVTQPVLIGESYVKPEYPEMARLARQEGEVILRAVVNTDGSVTEIELMRSTAPYFGFEESAIAAVEQWSYQPATQDGEPVTVFFVIQVKFSLL